MKINTALTDNSILAEFGLRLCRERIQQNLTQADLAKQAGISKRTLERAEAGHSLQLTSLIRVLRALDMLDKLDFIFPEDTATPMEMLKLKGKKRQRVTSSRSTNTSKNSNASEDNSASQESSDWQWKDDK